MAFSKQFLSGSTNGRPIKVVATATPGTLVHTAVAGTSSIDEVWIYCNNTDASDRKLTIEFGGVSAPDDLIEVDIPSESGPVLVVPGLPLQNGLAVRAFGAAGNVLIITGYVNRIVP